MIENHEGTLVITGESIPFARLLTLHSGLKLEAKGLKRRGRSFTSIIKQEFNLPGRTAKSILKQFDLIIEQKKADYVKSQTKYNG